MIAPTDTEQNETEAYLEVEDMLFKLAWDYCPHENEFDDMMGEARLAYAEALVSYDPEGGTKLTSWVWTSIYYHFLRVRRKAARTQLTTNVCDLGAIPAPESTDLSEDARYIVDLCLENRNGIEVDGQKYTTEQFDGAGFRMGLRRCAKKLGWTVFRIIESFDEIRRALG